MVNDLMNEAARLHVQRLEEKLLQAETSLQATKDNHASEITELKSRHNDELKTMQIESEKSRGTTKVRHPGLGPDPDQSAKNGPE